MAGIFPGNDSAGKTGHLGGIPVSAGNLGWIPVRSRYLFYKGAAMEKFQLDAVHVNVFKNGTGTILIPAIQMANEIFRTSEASYSNS